MTTEVFFACSFYLVDGASGLEFERNLTTCSLVTQASRASEAHRGTLHMRAWGRCPCCVRANAKAATRSSFM